MLCNSDEDVDTERSYVDVVVAERMAGVVIAVASPAESDLRPLLDRGIRVVAVDRRPVDADVDSVVVDNRLGAETATAAPARAADPRGSPASPDRQRVDTANERLQGYRDAHARLGVPVDRALVRRADFKLEGGYRAARSLLESPSPPDALFVANEPMTIGALRALRELGRRVPDDVALVGFDDAPWTTLTEPAGHRRVPARLRDRAGGGRAAGLGWRTGPARHVVCSPTLIVRESSIRHA